MATPHDTTLEYFSIDQEGGTKPGVEPPAPEPRKLRGFARMDRDRVREIARRGGRAAHEAGTAHEFTPEEAKAAGRKGGIASQSARKKPESTPPPTPEG